MVGRGVLIECLEDPRVRSILVLGRTPCGVVHPKLRELLRADFFDYSDVRTDLKRHLMRLPFKAYMFRPGYIQPLKGVRSKTRLYQVLYNVLRPLYPLLRRLLPSHVTTTVTVGRAMIRVAASGYSKRVLETPDINMLAVIA